MLAAAGSAGESADMEKTFGNADRRRMPRPAQGRAAARISGAGDRDGPLADQVAEHDRRGGRFPGTACREDGEHRDRSAAEALQGLLYLQRPVSPVGEQRHDPVFFDHVADLAGLDGECQVDLAGRAPVGREVDEHRGPGPLQVGDPGSRERFLPCDQRGHGTEERQRRTADRRRHDRTLHPAADPDHARRLLRPADPPAAQPDADQHHESGHEPVMLQEREQVGHRAQHHEAENLLEGRHPGARAGQEADEPRHQTDDDVGERHAGGDRHEHCIGQCRGLPEREAEHRTEKRPAARGRQHGAEHALEEGAERPLPRLDVPRLRADETGNRQFPDAEERKREGEHDPRHGDVEAGRCELLSPGEARPGEADLRGHAGRRQGEEDREHAEAVPEVHLEHLAPVAARLLGERHEFEAEHRQDAGHEVQEQAAGEAHEEHDGQRERSRGSRQRQRTPGGLAVRRIGKGHGVADDADADGTRWIARVVGTGLQAEHEAQGGRTRTNN